MKRLRRDECITGSDHPILVLVKDIVRNTTSYISTKKTGNDAHKECYECRYVAICGTWLIQVGTNC